MKGKELMIIAGIIIVLLVVIIVGGVMKKDNEPQAGTQTPGVGLVDKQNKPQEFVEVKTDGTKVNTSNKLAQTKTVDGLEIGNIRLTENGNLSKLLADVKNPTNKTLGDFPVNIVLIDKNGKELATIGGFIDKVNAGETAELNASATVDVANAYDFRIEK